MEKLTTHTGIGVPLRRSAVDTDQIIPAVYREETRRVIDQPATTRTVDVPAVYKTITKQVKVADAHEEQREVLCASNTPRSRISAVQQALRAAGFRTDISDQGDSYLLEADLPGFDKDSIHIDLSEDTLTISAERHSQHEEEDKKDSYVCCERSYGQYQRSFDVSGIDKDGIKAKYADGVLRLTLPKVPEVQPAVKRLEIE